MKKKKQNENKNRMHVLCRRILVSFICLEFCLLIFGFVSQAPTMVAIAAAAAILCHMPSHLFCSYFGKVFLKGLPLNAP